MELEKVIKMIKKKRFIYTLFYQIYFLNIYEF